MKNPKGFRGKYFSLAAILALSTTITLASETKSYTDTKQNSEEQVEYTEAEELTPPSDELSVVVISKKIKVKEVDAPFASEIYTKAKIEKSRAKDVYEFLNTQTSVTLLPNYGNKFAPLIDMRGYGINNGYQNIVVTVNGRRINNIDADPQMLTSIPINSIEKIEIIKGSGSVEYGDGANAGTINIITKDVENIAVKGYTGTNNAKFGSISLGYVGDQFSISGYIDNYSDDGARLIDALGNKDASWSRNKYLKFSFSPIKDLNIKLSKNISKMDKIYPNSMTFAQYQGDINSVNTGSNEGYYDSDLISLGLDYKISQNLTFDTNINKEKKTNKLFFTYKYNYVSSDTKVSYNKDNLFFISGIQSFSGDRKKTNSETTKKNLGYYAKTNYKIDENTFSIGGRIEKVKYTHKDLTHDLKSDKTMSAFDLGYNYKINNMSSIFVNINRSFLTPAIDHLFKFNGDFNSFITPMKVQTLNIGYNHISYPNKLKISSFYSDIKDEIYFDTGSFLNKNLDKTRKYGLEVYDKYNLLYNLYTTLNYSYIDTEIKESSVDPSIVGKGIPGVSKHNVKLSVGYNPTHRINLLVSHVYKSKAYAMSDFDESYGKMEAYNSTDFSASYKYKKFEFFVKVNNVFDEKNALFTDFGGATPVVYPVNYERNFMVGVSAKF